MADYQYGYAPITEDGQVWVIRTLEECKELIAAHADPDHYINRPDNDDLSPVVGYKTFRRIPATRWEEVPS